MVIRKEDIEIMAPVGSFESMMAAIQGGADSIYFGIEQLNMRSRSSNNFTTEDLKEIVSTCKKNNVKTYLTLNTIIYDNDLNLNAAQGAGIQTGRNVAELGVEAVITGNVGPNAFKTLNAAGVKIFLAGKQSAQQAIDSYKTGELKEVNQANVEGHWT